MYGGDRFGGGYARQSTPPVREGEELDVTIEAVGEKGDGIARKQGFVLFVPSTKAGDEVRIRVTKVLAKVGFAEKIGDAQKRPAQERPKKEAAPDPHADFDPQEDLDSEDFGDDSPVEGADEPAFEEGSPELDSGDEEDSEDDGEPKD